MPMKQTPPTALPPLAALSPTEEAAVARLRGLLREACSAFEFVVLRVPLTDGNATEAHHRAALERLFEAMHADDFAYREALVAREPKHDAQPFEPQPFDVFQAQATALDALAVVPADRYPPGHRAPAWQPAASVPWFESLAIAFDDPPYTLSVADPALHRTLFPRFCACTGLMPGEGVAVLDWVGDPEREPERSAWSPYFDAGKEWWGIWCLTVWNPRHRTLAAMAASTTD